MTTLAIAFALIVCAAVAKAVMDLSADGKLKWFPYDYWLKNESWRRKYKDRLVTAGEAFWGSSRWFVFLTDGWHLAQMIQHVCIFSAFALFVGWWAIALYVVYTGVFEVMYSRNFR